MSDAFIFPYDPIAVRESKEDELVLQVERDRAIEDYLLRLPAAQQDISVHIAKTTDAHGGLVATTDARLPALRGAATLVGGTVTVSYTAMAATSATFVARQVDGGTVGASYSITRVVGVSFTITAKDAAGATQALDTSAVAYMVFQ